MSTNTPKAIRTAPLPLLTAIAGPLVLVILLYAGAYMLVRTPDNDGTQQLRNFNGVWMARFFTPAVKAEAALTGESIEVCAWTDL